MANTEDIQLQAQVAVQLISDLHPMAISHFLQTDNCQGKPTERLDGN